MVFLHDSLKLKALNTVLISVFNTSHLNADVACASTVTRICSCGLSQIYICTYMRVGDIGIVPLIIPDSTSEHTSCAVNVTITIRTE